MISKIRFVLLLGPLLGLGVAPLFAQQQRPSPAEAENMVRTRPELIAQLQARMRAMGLTPAQIRDRLKSMGYPEDFLDAYLPGGTSADSTSVPSDDIFAAIRSLGIMDSTRVDSLRGVARNQRKSRTELDSAFLDTLSRLIQNDTTKEAIRRLLRNRPAMRTQPDSGFALYGLNLFRNDQSQFDPNTSGAVDDSYRIGPGDHLVLFLTGDVQASYQLDVTREGFVAIPNVGLLRVAGLTKGQLDDLLYARLGRAYSGLRRGPGATTQFTLAVSSVGTNQIIVTGDVLEPGSYRVSRTGTLMTALYAARGPTDNGSLRAVQVRRGAQVVGTFDMYDYLLRGDASRDIRLENGDVVFVPPRGPQVRITGGILRAATYEIKPGETLASLIDMAGGLTPSADRRNVMIERIVPPAARPNGGPSRRLVPVSSDLFLTGNGPPEPLENGDVVRVFEIPRRLTGYVAVVGSVWSPGFYAFVPGMQLSTAIRIAGGLRPDTYLGDVTIGRLRPDSTRTMLHSGLRDTTGVVTQDMALADGDSIQIFSIADMRSHRYVTIGGAVNKGGQFGYREGMTLRDLVLMAGGLKESALLTEAEVARLPENRAGGVTAVSTRVPLDSTFLFERGPDGRYLGPPGIPAPASRAPEVPLRPYDVVSILTQPDFELERMVEVRGEVKYPARYALKKKSERLSDIIERAGGLTADAYANGVVFTRQIDSSGRVGVDLAAVLRDPKHVDNQVLFDGDSIYIPRYAAVVMVRGEVNSPVTVAWVEGADVDYYVRGAGGATAKGDRKKAYVQQPNGKVESSHRTVLYLHRSVPEPQPGSVVWVPGKDPTEKRDIAPILASFAQVLATIVTLVAISRR